MLANATVLLVRHGEKDNPCAKDDSKDVCLNPMGKERAQKYVRYFGSYTARKVDGSEPTPIKLTHLFAAANSTNSHQPHETLKPLAEANPKLPFDYTNYKDADWKCLADDLRDKDHDGAAILICWHHGEIVDLANRLLGKFAPTSPPKSCWPPLDGRWDCRAFGWVMQIRYDANGAAGTDWVRVVSEALMFDDFSPPYTTNWQTKEKQPA
ncbi:MAG TPA: hypothetical protein VHS03_14885 [Gaiellaceae bacterium]|jgi:hypothetical protein|nr:hypothetical protein [Gaiellaceae bacterium]